MVIVSYFYNHNDDIKAASLNFRLFHYIRLHPYIFSLSARAKRVNLLVNPNDVELSSAPVEANQPR